MWTYSIYMMNRLPLSLKARPLIASSQRIVRELSSKAHHASQQTERQQLPPLTLTAAKTQIKMLVQEVSRNEMDPPLHRG